MKILYVCSLFTQKNSSAAIRNMTLVDGLIKNGHNVEVVTLDVLEIEKNNLYKEITNKITFLGKGENNLRDKKSKFYSGKLIKFLLKKLIPIIFFPDTHKRFIKLFKPEEFKDFDLLISSSDTKSSHFAALKFNKINPKIQWIQIWGDPWFDDVTLNKVSKFRVRGKEKFLLEKADKVVYISEITKDLISKKYPNFKNKIFSIPRSYYTKIHTKIHTDSSFRFLYTGVLSHGRNIQSFFDWYSKEEKLSNSFIDIYGIVSDDIKFTISNKNNIFFKGVLSYENILEEYKKTDVLIMIGNSKNSTQVPGKLYDYLGTNLPILCIMNSYDEPVSLFLKKFEQCYIITYDDLNNKSVNMEELLSFIKKRYLPVESFSSNSVARQLLDIIYNEK